MAALVAGHPDVHLTINLTPVLLQQIDSYVNGGGLDRALELTHRPASRLTAAERQELLSTFFDAHWHNQIFPHRRYKELFVRRRERNSFDTQDLRDLQMWFNLAWFAQEFRDADTELMTGEVVAIRRFVEQERGFTQAEIEATVAEQHKILRAVIPIHRALQDRAQIEISTTPYAHPILPLLVDTDVATVDRANATRPPRFAHPEDAIAQVRAAVEAETDGCPQAHERAERIVQNAHIHTLLRALAKGVGERGADGVRTDDEILEQDLLLGALYQIKHCVVCLHAVHENLDAVRDSHRSLGDGAQSSSTFGSSGPWASSAPASDTSAYSGVVRRSQACPVVL